MDAITSTEINKITNCIYSRGIGTGKINLYFVIFFLNFANEGFENHKIRKKLKPLEEGSGPVRSRDRNKGKINRLYWWEQV